MNPATAFAATFADELARCGLREAVVTPGSRNAPLALALWQRSASNPDHGRAAPAGRPPGPALRLHVRIDERSAAFLALGLAKASGRPVVVACTSGTAAAHFHAAVLEADESGVPLLVLTADRPPELRGTGANQAVDQLKLYGGAVRWFCEAGVPEARQGMNGYWRSLACRAWASASGAAGGLPGPVHVNVPLREPLVPGLPDTALPGASAAASGVSAADPGARAASLGADDGDWPEPLDGRPHGAPWITLHAAPRATFGDARSATFGDTAPATLHDAPEGALELPWTERGVIMCGDGCADPGTLVRLAEEAGWPLLAEPSSGARRGPHALSAYPYLLGNPEFMAAHQPDLIVSAGRPGLSRPQLALLGSAGRPGGAARHVVVAQGPGRWADPARTATDVTAAIRLAGAGRRAAGRGSAGRRGAGAGWLAAWQAADAAARQAADAVLDSEAAPSEPRLARDLAALLPDGALLWAASSLPIRDLDHHLAPRSGLRLLASRGVSGIDGLVSAAIGAALAHQAAGGGPAVALLGDLAFLHDLPGLVLGPDEPRPDLTLVVVNNNGGGIFSLLEQAGLDAPFERLFGTPHGVGVSQVAAAVGMPFRRLRRAADLASALPGEDIRIIELQASRPAGAALRARLSEACAKAVTAAG